jgi:hypothetical protein
VIKLLSSKDLIIEVIYNSILVIIDRLTKFRYIILYKESSIAKDLTYIFLRIIISIYNILIEIISDRDKLFISKF